MIAECCTVSIKSSYKPKNESRLCQNGSCLGKENGRTRFISPGEFLKHNGDSGSDQNSNGTFVYLFKGDEI